MKKTGKKQKETNKEKQKMMEVGTDLGGAVRGVSDGPPSTGDTISNWMGVSRLSPSTGVVVVEGMRDPLSLHRPQTENTTEHCSAPVSAGKMLRTACQSTGKRIYQQPVGECRTHKISVFLRC